MEKDLKLIQGVINRKEDAIKVFYELLYDISNSIVNKYIDKCVDKPALKKELANELCVYFMDNNELLEEFKGKSKLKTYLSSIGRHYFFSTRFDVDPLILEATREWKKLEKKQERLIKKIDKESRLYHVYKPTRIPTEFRDEDEESTDTSLWFAIDDENHNNKKNDHTDDIFFVNDNYDEDDVIIFDIDEIINTSSAVVYTDKRELVRQTLELMPPKQADLLWLQFFEGVEDNKELAKELGITIGALYNLRNKANTSFFNIFNQLSKQQNEAN